MARARQTDPTGKPPSDYRNICQAPELKIFRFSRIANQDYTHIHPVPLRGALAIVTTRGGERWTRKCLWRTARTCTAKTCGPDVAVLASIHPEAIAFRALRRQKSRSPGRARYKP